MSNEQPELLDCPHCGNQYLHQHNIEVWNRGEDDKEAYHLTISGNGWFNYDSSNIDNPSRRRQGLTIEFLCESCNNKGNPKLAIYQHKGQTFMKWLTSSD